MKRCSVCKEEKELSEFYKDKRGNQGVYGKCKSCFNSQARQKYHADIDQNREYNRLLMKKLRKSNPSIYYDKEKTVLRTRNWRQKNRERYIEGQRKRAFNRCQSLAETYVKQTLKNQGFTTAQINQNPELIQLKTAILKIKRVCKNNPQTSKNLEMTC